MSILPDDYSNYVVVGLIGVATVSGFRVIKLFTEQGQFLGQFKISLSQVNYVFRKEMDPFMDRSEDIP